MTQDCFDETRSHLHWAVRIIPVRKSPTGEDLDMKSLPASGACTGSGS